MSKKLIAISIAVLVIGLFSTVAMAGVEGSFDFEISLLPNPVNDASESVPFDIDFEGWLILDVTLSGLTFSNNLVFGVQGIEHYVTDLNTTLGALALNDEFWFAAPYITNTDGDLEKIGELMFVKKRVDLEMTLAGLNLDTLILFEDINFPDPDDTAIGTDSDADGLVGLDVDGNGVYETQTDSKFAFGAILTLSGETVSGIGVESILGLNADPQLTNEVKKYSADGVVIGKDIEFTVEKINITGISVAGVTIDNSLEFKPATPVSNTIDASFSLLDIADVVASWEFENILALDMTEATYTVSTDLLTLVLTDDEGDFAIDDGDTINLTASLPIQFLTLDVDLFTEVGTGFVTDADAGYAAQFAATLDLNATSFSATANYDDDGSGNLTFDTITYDLSTTVDNLNFGINATFTETALSEAGISVGVDFAV